MNKPPAPTPCPHCGSLECGPVRCRFSLKPRAVFLSSNDRDFWLEESRDVTPAQWDALKSWKQP